MGRNVLLDTNVFLAYIKGETQGYHAKVILENIGKGELVLHYNGLIRMEIENKYRYYLGPFCSILEELRNLGRVVDVDITPEIKEETLRLNKELVKYKKGKKDKFGFVDCLLILLAKRYGCIFVTIEKDLIEVAKEEGVNAVNPMTLAMSF